MTEAMIPIDVSDTPELLRLAEEVARTGRRMVLRRGDSEPLAVVGPVAPAKPARRRRSADEDRAAFLSAAGGWKDLDTGAYVEDVASHREVWDRPPIDAVRYLVDTDRIVDFLNGRPVAVELLAGLEPHGLAISIISYGEVYEGIYFGNNSKSAEDAFLRFVRAISVLPLNRSIMRRFARIRGRLRLTGLLIPEPDILIASTAIEHRLVVVTRNTTHFASIPDLEIYADPA